MPFRDVVIVVIIAALVGAGAGFAIGTNTGERGRDGEVGDLIARSIDLSGQLDRERAERLDDYGAIKQRLTTSLSAATSGAEKLRQIAKAVADMEVRYNRLVSEYGNAGNNPSSDEVENE